MRDRRAAERWRRLLLVGCVLLAAGAGFWIARRYLNYAQLQGSYQELAAWRDGHLVLSLAAYMAVYVAAVAFSVPGAVWLTLVGGFLFGVVAGSVVVVTAATLGATLVFIAARSLFSGLLRRRAGGWIDRMERGFRQGEVSFLLVMRLVPAVPFFIANLVPALLGARLQTFVWTTCLGIAPATVVFVSIGAGLGQELDRGQEPDLGAIFHPHILGPLLGLAALAALPFVLRRLGLARAPREPAE